MRKQGRSPLAPLAGQDGFTLIEVMLAVVLMTVGLLAVADVFPHGLALSLYGKEQTAAADLAQQKIEYYKNQATSTLSALVGDYATNVASEYFDQNGSTTTAAAAFFTRDVQIQYWAWTSGTSQFALPASPYNVPAVSYVYRISVAVHWLVQGQTSFTSNATPKGCVSGGVAVSTGLGCVQVSTFITP